MALKANQNFHCRITEDQQIELARAFESHGFNTNAEFTMTFAEMLNSGDITGHLRSYRLREVDKRGCNNLNKEK